MQWLFKGSRRHCCCAEQCMFKDSANAAGDLTLILSNKFTDVQSCDGFLSAHERQTQPTIAVQAASAKAARGCCDSRPS